MGCAGGHPLAPRNFYFLAQAALADGQQLLLSIVVYVGKKEGP
jgi:hypothetical protein